MSRLLEAILAYSKASAAPLSEFQTIDLKILVGEVEQDVSQRLKDTRGAIVTGRLDTVHGDARQLHQLLLNLISNGLKFHRADTPPRVLIESRRDDHCVHLTISDNGIGFDPAAAERIFMPFERLERNFEGSGIGLAIVRRVAERHGGMVRAASKPGEGSRFEVILPQNGARRS